MGKYSIRELEKLSGIKAHTIRIWEKRYNLVEPLRTESNIRFYSDSDLKKIINVSLLTNHGIRISNIAEMSDEELAYKVNELSTRNHASDIHIDGLITDMIDMDEENFVLRLRELESRFGFERTIQDIVYNFLQKIGVLWQTGNITPAHEHFISNLVRQWIIVNIASLPIPRRNTLRAVLFLPENEMHEIALLFYHYLVRKVGIRTYYLGQSVPHNDLKKVVDTHKPHYLITNLTSTPAPAQLDAFLEQLSDEFPQCQILASGSILRNSSFRYRTNIKIFEHASELALLFNR